MLKLVIYALLAYVAWHFIRKLLAGPAPGAAPRGGEKAGENASDNAGSRAAPSAGAQHLVQCAVCGTYVAGRCTRTNCPQ